MSSSNFFDGLLDENWEIATGAVVVVLAWIVGTRCFGGRSVVRQFPRTAACAELILAPLTPLFEQIAEGDPERRAMAEKLFPKIPRNFEEAANEDTKRRFRSAGAG